MEKSKREMIEEYLDKDSEVLFADGFDDCIIGLSCGYGAQKVVYDYQKVISVLCKDMSFEDAVEYFEYNIAGAYVGEHTPEFVDVI